MFLSRGIVFLFMELEVDDVLRGFMGLDKAMRIKFKEMRGMVHRRDSLLRGVVDTRGIVAACQTKGFVVDPEEYTTVLSRNREQVVAQAVHEEGYFFGDEPAWNRGAPVQTTLVTPYFARRVLFGRGDGVRQRATVAKIFWMDLCEPSIRISLETEHLFGWRRVERVDDPKYEILLSQIGEYLVEGMDPPNVRIEAEVNPRFPLFPIVESVDDSFVAVYRMQQRGDIIGKGVSQPCVLEKGTIRRFGSDPRESVSYSALRVLFKDKQLGSGRATIARTREEGEPIIGPQVEYRIGPFWTAA